MGNPRVSIIIPCYNGERFLEQTLKSVLWQTSADWECIIVDDGSTDRSSEIAKSYASDDSRFRYHKKNNGGLASARNAGILLAQGEFIQFLDADDLMTMQRLAVCVRYFDQHPHCAAVYSDYTLYTTHEGFIKLLPGKIPGEDQVKAFLFEFNKTFVIPIHAYLFRTKIIKANLFDESLLSFAEDNEFRIRLALQGIRFEFIDEVMAVYRMNSGQVTSLDESKIFLNMLQELEKYRKNPLCLNYRSEFEQQFVYLHQRIAIAYFMKKQFRSGLASFMLVRNNMTAFSILQVLVWGILMVFVSKDTIASFRSWISTTFKIKVGKWEILSVWNAPKEMIELLAS
jgi:glycosyltransferase involved in cell wall biosynthesis